MSSRVPRIPKLVDLLLTRATEKKEGAPTDATDERIVEALDQKTRGLAALMTAMPLPRDRDGGAS